MRCPNCNKFVSYDVDTDPEIEVTISDDGTVTGTCRIVNGCAECGTELKEANFDIEMPAAGSEDHDCLGHLEVEVEDAYRIEETQTLDRNGKTIKNPRYMKHLYGAGATFSVTCDKCDFSAEVPWKDFQSASGMDEL